MFKNIFYFSISFIVWGRKGRYNHQVRRGFNPWISLMSTLSSLTLLMLYLFRVLPLFWKTVTAWGLIASIWPLKISLKTLIWGASLVVQWLRLHASTAGGMGLIPGWETKIPRAVWHSQNIRINQNQNSDLRMLLLGLKNLKKKKGSWLPTIHGLQGPPSLCLPHWPRPSEALSFLLCSSNSKLEIQPVNCTIFILPCHTLCLEC